MLFCNEGSCVSECPSDKCNSDGTCVTECPNEECCEDGDCVTDCTGDCRACISGECQNDPSLCNSNKCLTCNTDGWCETECETGKCCDGSGECVTPDDWESETFGSRQVEAPDGLVEAIEGAIRNIPGCSTAEFTLDVSTATGADSKDCCDNEHQLDEDGVVAYYGNIEGAAGVSGIKVWPSTPDYILQKTNPLTGTVYKVTVGGGLYFSAGLSVRVEGGERADSCIPETCGYGSFTGEATAELMLGIEVKLCRYVPEGDPEGECLGIEIGGTISTGIEGGYTYNSRDDCNGGRGELGWSGFDGAFEIEVTAPGGYSWSYHWDAF